jgi:hypothetical protein
MADEQVTGTFDPLLIEEARHYVDLAIKAFEERDLSEARHCVGHVWSALNRLLVTAPKDDIGAQLLLLREAAHYAVTAYEVSNTHGPINGAMETLRSFFYGIEEVSQPSRETALGIGALLHLTEKDWNNIGYHVAKQCGAGVWPGGNSHYWGVRNWLKEQHGIDDTWDRRQALKKEGHAGGEDYRFVDTALSQQAASLEERYEGALATIREAGEAQNQLRVQLAEANAEIARLKGLLEHVRRVADPDRK